MNILTGKESELLEHFGTHMDINALCYAGVSKENFVKLKNLGTDNVKRVRRHELSSMDVDAQNPYLITDFTEIKTTWHPIENIGGSTSSY
jgi:hypothetical protein